MKVNAELVDGTIRSGTLKCFEHPTDGTHAPDPLFNASDVAPDDPNAQVKVRKAVCSGNNDQNGELIDIKSLLGMVELSNGDFLFHSQEESAFFLHGDSPFDIPAEGPSGKVVMTLIVQGGAVVQPPDPDFDLVQSYPLLLPGSSDVVGTQLQFHHTPPQLVAPELFEVNSDFEFFIILPV